MKRRCRRAALVTALAVSVLSGEVGRGQGLPTLEVEVFGRAQQPGEVVRLDVTCTCGLPEARTTATLLGREVPLFPVPAERLWRGLIGLDLALEPGVYPMRILVERMDAPPVRITQELRVAPKQFRTRRLRVLPRFVEPPAEDLERIRSEAARLQSLFGAMGPRLWEGAFILPVSEPPSSSFGSRSVFNGRARAPHSGADFASGAGTPILAPASGTVLLAENLFFTGNTVVIDHGTGLQSLMAHLSAISVAEGDLVRRGETVGLVGATGRVTGPHLHWAVRLNGARVDPLSLVAATE